MEFEYLASQIHFYKEQIDAHLQSLEDPGNISDLVSQLAEKAEMAISFVDQLRYTCETQQKQLHDQDIQIRHLQEQYESADELLHTQSKLVEQVKDECIGLERELAECRQSLQVSNDCYEESVRSLKEARFNSKQCAGEADMAMKEVQTRLREAEALVLEFKKIQLENIGLREEIGLAGKRLDESEREVAVWGQKYDQVVQLQEQMELEWQQWDLQNQNEQKNRLGQLDKLQCQLESMQEQLKAKDQEINRLKISTVQEVQHDFIYTQEFPQEQVQHDLVETNEFNDEYNDLAEFGLYEDQLQVPERQSPEEEYFKLAVLAIKLQFNQVDQETVFNVSSKKLYKQCLQEQVPFHKWHQWIHNTLTPVKPAPQKEAKEGFMDKLRRKLKS